MRTISTTIEIGASPHAVWEVLTDLSGYPRWNPFLRKASGQVAVGQRLTLQAYPANGRPMTFRPRILAVATSREWRWIGRLLVPGLFDGEHSFSLSPTPAGRTRLVQAERFTGVLVPFTGQLIKQTRAGFIAMNEALKKHIEDS
jgi:hypothetical protein